MIPNLPADLCRFNHRAVSGREILPWNFRRPAMPLRLEDHR
jgi:hypothetical protein